MYETSPFFGFKGETRQLLSEDINLESFLGLDPALEETLDLSEFETNTDPVSRVGSPPGVPDRSAVSPALVTREATVDLLSLTATTQHLAQLEGHPAIFTADHGVAVNHHHSTLPSPHVVSAPSLVADDSGSTFPDDALMPAFQPFVTMSTSPAPSTVQQGGAEWSQPPFYSTVKTEELTLTSLATCSVEANLPGYTTTITDTNNLICKSEPMLQDDLSCSQFTDLSASPRSTRSLSESSTATSVAFSDSSSRRSSKGGSRRRQVPKGCEEYKEKRARNNVAVRKSRAKAKDKQRSTESRVKDLVNMNDSLQKKVEMLTKELAVLKGLFINVGASLPDDFSKLMEQS